MVWIQTADRMPTHGQRIVKRWRNSGNVWAGIHVGGAKYASFDEWCALPD